MKELERNSRTPVFLGTVKIGTTGELALHLRTVKRGVVYKKVCPGVLSRHNSSNKRLNKALNEQPRHQEDNQQQKAWQSCREEKGHCGGCDWRHPKDQGG